MKTHAEYLLEQAAFADQRANSATDPQIRESWAMLADNYRALAKHYQKSKRAMGE